MIPEIGAINDWDNVAIVMKFPTKTLAQVGGKQTHLDIFGDNEDVDIVGDNDDIDIGDDFYI